MSKYTEGPWKVDGEGIHALVRGADMIIVAVRHRLDGTTHMANAHLIAAAPDMLGALHKIIEMNRQHAEDQYGDPNKAETWSCVVVARAAIKKAEGEL